MRHAYVGPDEPVREVARGDEHEKLRDSAALTPDGLWSFEVAHVNRGYAWPCGEDQIARSEHLSFTNQSPAPRASQAAPASSEKYLHGTINCRRTPRGARAILEVKNGGVLRLSLSKRPVDGAPREHRIVPGCPSLPPEPPSIAKTFCCKSCAISNPANVGAHSGGAR